MFSAALDAIGCRLHKSTIGRALESAARRLILHAVERTGAGGPAARRSRRSFSVTAYEATGMTGGARIDGGSVPHLPRHVKFRFDETRKQWVLLAPERLLLPDHIAVEILQRVDGQRSVDEIVGLLAEKFEASREEIAADVLAMLQDLIEKGYLGHGDRGP